MRVIGVDKLSGYFAKKQAAIEEKVKEALMLRAKVIQDKAKYLAAPPPKVWRFTRLPTGGRSRTGQPNTPVPSTSDSIADMIEIIPLNGGLTIRIVSRHWVSLWFEFGTGDTASTGPFPNPPHNRSFNRGMYASPFMVPALETSRMGTIRAVKAALGGK